MVAEVVGSIMHDRLGAKQGIVVMNQPLAIKHYHAVMRLPVKKKLLEHFFQDLFRDKIPAPHIIYFISKDIGSRDKNQSFVVRNLKSFT